MYRKRYDDAINVFKQSRKYDPVDPTPAYNLACCYSLKVSRALQQHHHGKAALSCSSNSAFLLSSLSCTTLLRSWHHLFG